MTDLITALLGWLKRPWQGVVLILVIPLISVAVFLWMEREVIDELLRERYAEPTIDPEKAEEVAGELLRHADLVVVFKVELVTNTQSGYLALTARGNVRDLETVSVPFIPSDPSRTNVALQELAGATICWEVLEADRASMSGHIRWYLDNGYGYVCARKIPLRSGHLIGVAHLVWRTKPERSLEYSARVAMGAHLDNMVD